MSAAIKYMKDSMVADRFVFLHVEKWMEILQTDLRVSPGIPAPLSFIPTGS